MKLNSSNLTDKFFHKNFTANKLQTYHIYMSKQAGAKLCQAHVKLCLQAVLYFAYERLKSYDYVLAVTRLLRRRVNQVLLLIE